MKEIIGSVYSVHTGNNEDMSKESIERATVNLQGFENDKHQGFTRITYEGESIPEGTIRRNDRQWSAVSIEEIKTIEKEMDLSSSLLPGKLGVNLCFVGIPNFSQLTKGTQLCFPSGAVLMVEDYNPPCQYMSQQIAKIYKKRNGDEIKNTDFSKAAKKLRGLVGSIDVEGEIGSNDSVVVKIYDPSVLSSFLK